jgi:hypothetical protein
LKTFVSSAPAAAAKSTTDNASKRIGRFMRVPLRYLEMP